MADLTTEAAKDTLPADKGTDGTDAGGEKTTGATDTKTDGAGDDKSKTPNGGKETGTDDGADKGDPKPPVKYELVVPEGDRIDADEVAQVVELAKANGWTNEQAQQELDAYHTALIEQSDRFLTATRADKDYGGDNLAETQRLADSVIAFVRPKDHPRAASFMKVLTKGGYINHIEIVAFLADLGKQMAEDKPLHGRDGGNAKDGEKKTQAEVLYGKK